MAGHFRGTAGQVAQDKTEIQLERPNSTDFEKALVGLGFDENDARRLTTNSGRHGQFLDGNTSQNPAIRRPAWLDHSASQALSTLCLLGGWSSGNADKQ
jgi:hypothetical protein